jgi:4-hydroxy-3-polyprenylbenzoate decarboxylase
MPGVVSINTSKFTSYTEEKKRMESLENMDPYVFNGFKLIIVCDDSGFVAEELNNFLWVTFTRSNPSHDIYGVASFTENKHWGCKGPLIIDARIKPHHAPPLIKDPEIEKKVDALGVKGQPLYGII